VWEEKKGQTYLATIVDAADSLDLIRAVEGGLEIPPKGHHLLGLGKPGALEAIKLPGTTLV